MASSLASLTSGFFPSNNHDRLYTADHLANMFSALISDGIVQSSSGDPSSVPFKVAFSGSDNTAVTIGKGLAWLNNTWSSNVAIAALSMTDTIAIDVSTGTRRTNGSPANNSNPRWDAIAIEVNKSPTVRANNFVVVEGVPGSNPSKPNAHSCDNAEEGRFYYTIAFVYRPAGSGTVIGGQTSDKLLIAVAQNGGTPYITSLVSEPTSIDDLLTRWNDEVEASVAELQQKIAEAGSMQLLDGVVTTPKIVDGAVTNDKIAAGTINKNKLAFSTVELNANGKIPADVACSLVMSVSSSRNLTASHAGNTLRVSSASAITLTLPSTESWTTGTEMEIVRWGTGPVTIAASGNTKFYSASNGEQTSINVANRYGTIVMKMMNKDMWLVAGDIG